MHRKSVQWKSLTNLKKQNVQHTAVQSVISIRTGVFKDGKAYIQAGGGIVYDSIPENEYRESINKASAVLRAIEEAGDIV